MKILLNMTNSGAIHPNVVQNLISFYQNHPDLDIILQTSISDNVKTIIDPVLQIATENEVDYVLFWGGDVEIMNAGFFEWLTGAMKDGVGSVYFENEVDSKFVSHGVQLVDPKNPNGTSASCGTVVLRLW